MKVRAGAAKRLCARLVFLLAIVGIFILDSVVPRGAMAAILYLVVVLLVARDEDRTRACAFASLVTLLCVVAYFEKAPGAGEQWKSLFNRVLIVASAWFIVLAMPRRRTASPGVHVEVTAEERTALADTSDVEHEVPAPDACTRPNRSAVAPRRPQ